MGKEKLTVKGSWKYAVFSLVVWFIALFLVAAGINTMIKNIFIFLKWSNDIVYILQMIVTIIILGYYLILIVRTVKDLKYIANHKE